MMAKRRRHARPSAGPRRVAREVQLRAAPTSAPATRGARQAWWRWALLVGLVLAAYGRVLNADFVNWDDPKEVYGNLRVTAPDALARSWSDGSNPGFYPVLYDIYHVEWRAAAGKPWLFHLDNVLLHATNAVLVGSLAGELGLAAPAPWLVASLWALHPVHVESVAWVTERKNVLYTFFWLAALLAYVRGGRATAGRRPLFHAAALVLFVCSLLSKGAAITLPIAIVLIEWYRGRRLDRRLCFVLSPYVARDTRGSRAHAARARLRRRAGARRPPSWRRSATVARTARSRRPPPDVAIDHLYPPYTDAKVRALAGWFEY